jgi:hypothetical protein
LIKDVVLIGLGIVGQVALEELAESNLDIAVIDVVRTTSDLHFLRDIDGNKSVWTRGSRVAGFPGGRLNWGKNCSFVTIQGHPPLGEHLHSQLPQLSRRLRKYGFPSLKPVELAKSGEGEFYVVESKEFPHKKWISRIESFRNVQIISGYATKITQEDSGLIRILVRNPNHSLDELVARKILICAGPFGTQELLANSGLLSENNPQIRDHISFELDHLPLRTVKLSKLGLFGWNRIRKLNVKRCSTFYDETNNILWTLRLFPEGVLSLRMSFSKLFRDLRNREYFQVFSIINSLAGGSLTGKFLFQGIRVHISADFLDKSGLIRWASFGEGERIDFLEYESLTIPISREFIQFIYKTIKNLNLDFKNDVKLSLSHEVEIAKVTSSSHHMGTVWSTQSQGAKSPLEMSGNILVAGSSIFQSTVPGHPTMLAAASALVATDQIKSALS